MVEKVTAASNDTTVYKEFHLDEYIDSINKKKAGTNTGYASSIDRQVGFLNLCDKVREYFNKEWEKEGNIGNGNDNDKRKILLDRQKNAIIGYPTEVNFFKEKIKDYLKANGLVDEKYPPWYSNLVDAIFHENWGLAGVAKWKELIESSSAKIIGDRIFYLIDGKQVLQEQRISPERFEQLRQALLLNTPKVKYNQDYYELYMYTGERIAIYCGDLTAKGLHSMVFRKYIIKNNSLEEQSRRKTISDDSIALHKSIAMINYNMAVTGAVRTGKTTFLVTALNYKDPSLEGVLIQTDPEIQIEKILPNSPILSIIADGEQLHEIKKSILRSDADYLILAEARDGNAYDLAVEVANKGTLGCITTMHLSDPIDFCFEVASKIHSVVGGKIDYHIAKVAKSYHYIYEFIQLKNKSQKRLKGIHELRYDKAKHTITMHQICRYERDTDSWTYKYDIGEDKRKLGMEENPEAFKMFDSQLKKLSEKYPMEGESVFYPVYSKVGDIINA